MKKSPLCHVSLALLLVGGLNWGLVGLSMLMGGGKNLNIVNLLVGKWPMVEGAVYLLVGVMALKVIVFALAGKCSGDSCKV